MTVAALECAALQRCSFLLSIKVRTPCTGHSVRGDFFLLFLLACLCELHRIRIVQAEMGLAGSRTSFSFPPNRKPSFLSAIFCICHHVCPLVHPNLPVTAFGWQFLYRGCVFVVTVFLLAMPYGSLCDECSKRLTEQVYGKYETPWQKVEQGIEERSTPWWFDL